MLTLRKSKAGFIVGGLFLLLALLGLAAHLYSMATNPQDGGESAVIMIPFALPWILWIPKTLVASASWQWLTYPVFGGMALLNAFILYCVFGGLRPKKP